MSATSPAGGLDTILDSMKYDAAGLVPAVPTAR